MGLNCTVGEMNSATASVSFYMINSLFRFLRVSTVKYMEDGQINGWMKGCAGGGINVWLDKLMDDRQVWLMDSRTLACFLMLD